MVTSLRVGVFAVFVVARKALYFRYLRPWNWLRDVPDVVKNVAAVPLGPTNVNGPPALLLPATWNCRDVPDGKEALVQDKVVQFAMVPATGLASFTAETRFPALA